MLKFYKYELKRQGKLASDLLSVPPNSESQELLRLISEQQQCLESLIQAIENPSLALFLTNIDQQEIMKYCSQYSQQQILLVSLGYTPLPDLVVPPELGQRLQTQENTGPSFQDVNISRSSVGFFNQSSVDSDAPKEETPLVDSTKSRKRKTREFSGASSLEVQTPAQKFRARQKDMTQNLEKRVKGLETEKVDLKQGIGQLQVENTHLHSYLMSLRTFLSNALQGTVDSPVQSTLETPDLQINPPGF